MDTHSAIAKLTPEATIEEIITADRKAGVLLASIGIKTKSHKDESLRSVCQQLKWSEEEVMKWIQKNKISGPAQPDEQKSAGELDFGDNLSDGCHYLAEDSHPKLLFLLGEITCKFPRIHQVHGNQYPWLKHLQRPLGVFDDKLQFYIYFESKKFFPLLGHLHNGNGEILDGMAQKIERGIEIIEDDWNELSELMNTIERMGNQLDPPGGACSTLRIFNSDLKKLFSMLRQEIHIGKTVILPLAKEKLTAA
ncbi:MAG: hypothetical protein WD035_07045 [Balneolaceae bacterium]